MCGGGGCTVSGAVCVLEERIPGEADYPSAVTCVLCPKTVRGGGS